MTTSKNKVTILQRLDVERRRLVQNLARLTPDDMLEPGVVKQWTVKDVLAHLADWEARFPVWLEAARHGNRADCPDPAYTWRQIDQLNAQIYLAHRDRRLDSVLEFFHAAHRQFMQAVATLTDDELLTPAYYPFTEKASILDWLNGFANHDLWAKTKIRQWLRTKGR